MSRSDADPRPVRVWDLPTRLFHWTLALSIVGSVVSAKIGGNAMEWHIRLGLLALALLVFRLVWGFVGGHWSRFGSFLYSPGSLRAYLRGDAGPDGRFEIGHSPLGALSVFALLALLVVQVLTGLIADDEIATTGPLNRFVSTALGLRATSWHNTWGQYGLYALVALHVGAVLYYLFARRRNLVGAMWHGDKHLAATVRASADTAATRLLALALFAAGLVLAWWIARLGAG
jgi:cytochrome b